VEIAKNLEASHLNEHSIFGDDCPVFVGMFEYMLRIAGSSLEAADQLNKRAHDIMINWDGGNIIFKHAGRHHCKRDSASGFCYVNDIVLSILKLHEVFQRVVYIDIDIHHSDGVEEAFEYSKSVYTISFHYKQVGFFPGLSS
jgi:acetoin utilization deacetylase AcuC-like enzyme